MLKKRQPKSPSENFVQLSTEEYAALSFIVYHLGETVTAALAGATNRQVQGWINHPRSEAPDSVQLQRIHFAESICADVVQAQGPTLTRRWFIGEFSSKGSGPLNLIRDGRYDEVRESAEVFKQENRQI